VPGPDPERDYYSFIGWISSEYMVYVAGDTVNEQETVLTAQWIATVYDVTYELNGGYYSWGGDELFYSVEDPKGLISPEKDGSTFEGWYTTPNFSGSQIYELHPSLGNVTLYAKWSSVTPPDIPDPDIPDALITVHFYSGTEDDTEVKDLPATIETSGIYVTIPEEIPSREGYTFVDWVLGDLEGYSIMPGETLDCDVWGYTLELYARWSAIWYNIDYELNGGNWDATLGGYAESSYCPVENVLPTLYVPQKPGYIFDGWYLNPDFEGEKIADLNGQTGDLILYAKWIQKVSTQVWIRTVDKWSKGVIFVKTEDDWKLGMPKINIGGIWKPNIKS
jgi:uncharacterized repeat protein (TIGR02543 family)